MIMVIKKLLKSRKKARTCASARVLTFSLALALALPFVLAFALTSWTPKTPLLLIADVFMALVLALALRITRALTLVCHGWGLTCW